MSKSVEERYPFVTENMSVQFKDWAAGTSKHVDHDDFVVSVVAGDQPTYQCIQKTVKYPPALWKIIDEPIVNAIDHFIRCLGSQNPVTKIAIGFDSNGVVSIWNNGIGIEVVKHAAAAQALGLTEIYVPTMIFGHMRQGSNYDNEAQPDCIIGGTNGMGATLGIIRSEIATVETVDTRQKPPKYFSQTWKNNREIVLDPIVFDLNVQNCLDHKLTANQICSHTSFTFEPSYTKTFNYKTFGPREHETLSEVLRMRAWMAAAYVGYTLDNMKPAKSPTQVKSQSVPTKLSSTFDIKFNNEDIAIRSMDDLAAIMFPTSTRLTTVLWPDKQHPAWHYPWEVCIIICDRTGISRQHKKYLSNVNGVLVSSGTHIRYIMDQLSVAVQHRISGKSAQQVEVNAATLSENMFLLLNCKVPNPGWSGQRKDDLTLNAESLKCLESYKFPKTFLDKFAACIRDQIIDRKLGKTTRRSHIDYDKYIPAKNMTNGALIICEGDSAMNRILEVGIAKCLNKDDYGVISTGGVPMNARKAVKEIATKNSIYLQRSDQYNNNKFISALVQACNLNYQYTYSENILINGTMQPNPNYKKEIASLNYRGGIIFIVDQDLDGMGNIQSLILGKFELFWKGLIHFGYCNTFLTPIIRAYPKSGGRVISFYNNEQYNDWVKLGQIPYTSNANTPQPIQPKTRGRGRGKANVVVVSSNVPLETQQTPPNLKKYDISYYKGLGTHSREETISMFRAFLNQLYKFYLDEKSNRMFITCFDKQSSLRKEELMKPLPIYTRDQIVAQMELKRISCTDHLLYVFGEYARDNLARKLNHVIDGQNQAGRKILDGIIKAFKSHNKKTKADTLAGYIKEKENYHHGVVSLETSVQIRAFIATGGAQLPLLIPHSNLGSRKAGGDDRAAARYTDVTLNKKLVPLLFSELDYPNLDFHFDEGNRGEPKFFVPLLPIVVLESINVPSTGWRIKTWARCVFETIDRVRYMIQYTDKFIGGELSPSIYKGAPYEWKGDFRTYGTEMYSFGVYVYDSQSNTITITELPLRVWTSDYLKCIGKRINCTHGGAGDDSKDGENTFKPKYKAKPKKPKKANKPSKPAKPELFDNTNNLVDGYESRGDDLNIIIIIKLKPGAISILEDYGTSFMDGIESYFMLGDHMDQGINLMGMDMNALEFTNYNDPINTWFLVRKKFYKLRLERIRLLNVLAQKREENIIRYIEIYQTLKIPNKSDEEQNAILGDHKFDRINSTLLDNPKFTANNDLESAILGGSNIVSDEVIDVVTQVNSDNVIQVGDDVDTLVETPTEDSLSPANDKIASYNYLLNITDRGKSTQSLAKHKAKLVDLNRELGEHDTLAAQGRFMGAQVWLNELNEVESVIKAGMSTFWMFERANKFQFDD